MSVTLLELSKLNDCNRARIEVKSGYNGKVLCKRFNEKKHESIADRQVLSFWPEIRIENGDYCYPIICCFVEGLKELEQELARRRQIDA